MSETAFRVIMVVMFCISNFQTFIIFCALTVINKNTEWGRYILPPQIKEIVEGGNNKNDTGR